MPLPDQTQHSKVRSLARPIAVSLHLGAHKTASTHLQKSLARNGDLLAQNAIRYFGPKFLRHKEHAFLDLFALRAEGEAIGNRSGPEQIEWLADGAKQVVLSEENILGPVFNKLNSGVLYPQADLRIERFTETISPHPVTVFIAIREPAKWLASLYSQRVIGGDLRSFEEFVGDNTPELLKWSNLIERLAKIPGERQIFVWRKEDYPEVAAPVLRRMIGWRLGPLLERVEGRVNAGLSSAAIEKLVEWGNQGRDGNAKEWAKELRKTFGGSNVRNVFDPWAVDTKEKSAIAYDEDVARIERMGQVEVLKPSRRSRS